MCTLYRHVLTVGKNCTFINIYGFVYRMHYLDRNKTNSAPVFQDLQCLFFKALGTSVGRAGPCRLCWSGWPWQGNGRAGPGRPMAYQAQLGDFQNFANRRWLGMLNLEIAKISPIGKNQEKRFERPTDHWVGLAGWPD